MRYWVLFFAVMSLLLGCASAPSAQSGATVLSDTTAVSPTPSVSSLATEATALPEPIWQRPFGTGLKGPAAYAAGNLFVVVDTAVFALDPATGATRWEVRLPTGIWPRSLSANESVVVMGSPGQMTALNPVNGMLLWQLPLVGDLLWAPRLTADTVFAGTAFVGPGITPNPEGNAWVYAVAIHSGEVKWAQETAVYSLTTPASNGLQLFVGGSFLQPETDVEEGGLLRLYAFDQVTGELQWQTERQDGFIKSLAADANTLFLLAYTDMVYGLDSRSGELRWEYPTENWSPGFSEQDGVLFLGSDNGFVHGVAGETGTAVWQTQLDGVFNAPRTEPTLDDNFAYFQGNDNRFYALDLTNGALRWQTAPQPRARVPLTLGDGWLFLVDQEGTLAAFQRP